MNDLISRQMAIDAICKVCPLTADYHKCNGYPKESTWCEELVALRALPSAQSEQRWIPCSEKYPDMDERVLVYTVSHDYHVWDCMSNRADNYFWEDEDGLYHDKYKVDMWMPLSQPYRKDGD